jgi:hypothetical protein
MLVFIHINKTGGRTARYILRSSFGLRHCEVQPWHARWKGAPFSMQDLHRVRKLYPNLKSIAGHRVTGHVDLQEDGREFRYFTLMRDPLTSCASRFQYQVNVSKKHKNLVFEDWIQQDTVRNYQTKWIAGVDDVSEAIRIIHDKNIFVCMTERYDESLLLLKRLVANDLNIAYRRVNVARDNAIKERLLTTDSTRKMLIEAQRADLELYDYVRHGLFPTYQKEYGPSLEADVANYQQTRENNFNYWNLTLSRLKQYMLYKPLVYLYRRGVTIG